MGYYVDLVEADFTIPEREDVLEALREMPKKYKALQRGGDGTNKWFSWMSDEEIENAVSVKAVFESLGFDCFDYGNNTFGLSSYNNKMGQEDLFLATVAPFVESGSYTQWRGEDGELWRYTVRYGKLTVQTPREIQWNDNELFRVAVFQSSGSFKDNTYTTNTIYVDPYGDIDSQIGEKTNA